MATSAPDLQNEAFKQLLLVMTLVQWPNAQDSMLLLHTQGDGSRSDENDDSLEGDARQF